MTVWFGMEHLSRRRWRLVSAHLVIALYTLSLLFCKFINTTPYQYVRYEPSSPVNYHAPRMGTYHSQGRGPTSIGDSIAATRVRVWVKNVLRKPRFVREEISERESEREMLQLYKPFFIFYHSRYRLISRRRNVSLISSLSRFMWVTA